MQKIYCHRDGHDKTKNGPTKQYMERQINSNTTKYEDSSMPCLANNVIYGCETWTTKKADDRKIEAAEMWFYRRLLRVKWTERKTNDSILKELGTHKRLLTIISKRKLKYIGHASRNKNTDLMKTIIQGKIEPQRRKGRPSTSYINSINRSLDLSLQNISQASQDRKRWQKIVRTRCSAANIDNHDADR